MDGEFAGAGVGGPKRRRLHCQVAIAEFELYLHISGTCDAAMSPDLVGHFAACEECRAFRALRSQNEDAGRPDGA